jgi:hypothetical protein
VDREADGRSAHCCERAVRAGLPHHAVAEWLALEDREQSGGFHRGEVVHAAIVVRRS